jgi:hypothetical protein
MCRSRTDGLAPTIKYWMYRSNAGDMGPVSLVVVCQQKLVFFPLPHWLLLEGSWIRTHGSDGRRAMDCVGSPSSWGQCICTNLLMSSQKAAMHWPREIRMIDDHTQTERGKCVTCWSGSPCRVYIDSNHRDSQIWVSLVYDSHHVANLMNLISLIVTVIVLLNTLNYLQLLYD